MLRAALPFTSLCSVVSSVNGHSLSASIFNSVRRHVSTARPDVSLSGPRKITGTQRRVPVDQPLSAVSNLVRREISCFSATESELQLGVLKSSAEPEFVVKVLPY